MVLRLNGPSATSPSLPIRYPGTFIEAVLLIKSAAAATNGELGLLPANYAQADRAAVEELLTTRPVDQFPVSDLPDRLAAPAPT